MSVLLFLLVFCAVYFIWWQFKMLKKYVLTFDRFSINTQKDYVQINHQIIPFADIAFISVREKEQPTTTEKMLSKSACYAYMAEMIFHLQDDICVSCVFNTKGALYKALKQLAPYLQINADTQKYKPRTSWGYMLLICAAVIMAAMCKSCA